MQSTNRIILDTTFVLPFFGIKINLGFNFRENLKIMWNESRKDFELVLPSICLIESFYKLLSEYRDRENFEILNRYQLILPTILNSKVEIFNPELNQKASLIAAKIRDIGHPDIMDCWIAASAVVLNGILLTEDNELKSLLRSIPERKDMKIWSWNTFRKNFFD